MSNLAHIINLAEKGDASAQNELGILYMAGRHGLKEDKEKGFYWLEQAAAQGLSTGIFNLGLAYQEAYMQDNSQPEKATKAFHLYQQAAHLGDASAQYQLAYSYMTSMGIKHDVAQATLWYEKAANQGDAQAQHALAELCLGKYGGLYNPQKAEKLLVQSAEQGLLSAQLTLARCFENGKKLPLNIAKAAYWYGKALEQGFTLAQTQKQLVISYAPESALFGLVSHILKQQDDSDKELASIGVFTEFVTDVVAYWNQKTDQMSKPNQDVINQWYNKLSRHLKTKISA